MIAGRSSILRCRSVSRAPLSKTTSWSIRLTLSLVPVLVGFFVGPVQASQTDSAIAQHSQSSQSQRDSPEHSRNENRLIQGRGSIEREWAGRPRTHLRRQRVDLDPALAGGQTKRLGDTLVLEVLGGDTYVAVVTRKSEYIKFSNTYTCRLTGYPLSLAIITVVNGRLSGTIYLTEKNQYYQIAFSPETGGYCQTELDPKSFSQANANDQVGGSQRSGTGPRGGRR